MDGEARNLKTDGSPGGVKVIKQGFNVDPLMQKQADCISTMTYNEYWQVIDAGYKPSQLVVFKYSDEGVATMEDGLYVHGAEAEGRGVCRQDGEVRQGLRERLGLGEEERTRKPPRSCSPPIPPARRRCNIRNR